MQANCDLLDSYEKDFLDCLQLLEEIVNDADPIALLDKNKFALDNASKLLKQMEVEAMNFMSDDSIRKKITSHKTNFDKVRKEIRKLQREAERKNLMGGHDSLDTGDDIEMTSKHERILLHNRNKLEEAKQVGLECDSMARDIKVTLRQQSDKLENKTLKNLYGMQTNMVQSNRLIGWIKKNRFKNKLILWGILALLMISVIFVAYVAFAPESTPAPIVQAPQETNVAAVIEPELDLSNEELPEELGVFDNGTD